MPGSVFWSRNAIQIIVGKLLHQANVKLLNIGYKCKQWTLARSATVAKIHCDTFLAKMQVFHQHISKLFGLRVESHHSRLDVCYEVKDLRRRAQPYHS